LSFWYGEGSMFHTFNIFRPFLGVPKSHGIISEFDILSEVGFYIWIFIVGPCLVYSLLSIFKFLITDYALLVPFSHLQFWVDYLAADKWWTFRTPVQWFAFGKYSTDRLAEWDTKYNERRRLAPSIEIEAEYYCVSSDLRIRKDLEAESAPTTSFAIIVALQLYEHPLAMETIRENLDGYKMEL
jgi:hypothetical protein